MSFLLRLLPLLIVVSAYSNSHIAHQLSVRYLSDVDTYESLAMYLKVYAKVGWFRDDGHGSPDSECVYLRTATLISESEALDKYIGQQFDFSHQDLARKLFAMYNPDHGKPFNCASIIVVEYDENDNIINQPLDYDVIFDYDINQRKFTFVSPFASAQFMN